MRLRQRREIVAAAIEVADAAPGPEEVLEQHAIREWVWHAMDRLSADERATLM
jgi:RNA polymerase sigma-70 factor (ECF subfamily)